MTTLCAVTPFSGHLSHLISPLETPFLLDSSCSLTIECAEHCQPLPSASQVTLQSTVFLQNSLEQLDVLPDSIWEYGVLTGSTLGVLSPLNG